jgi:hypothetical protein
MTNAIDALSERIFGALIGAAELCTVELGRELGLYTALRDGPQTHGTPGSGWNSRPRRAS